MNGTTSQFCCNRIRGMTSNSLRLVAVFVFIGVISPSVLFAQQEGQLATVRVMNSTGGLIRSLYVSGSSSRHWGPELLRGTVIPPGTGRDLRVHALSGCSRYDVLAELDDGSRALARGLSACLSPVRIWTLDRSTLGPGGEPTPSVELRLTNAATDVIDYLFVTPVDALVWGPDVLGEARLFPGGTIRLSIPGEAAVVSYDVLWFTSRGMVGRRRIRLGGDRGPVQQEDIGDGAP